MVKFVVQHLTFGMNQRIFISKKKNFDSISETIKEQIQDFVQFSNLKVYIIYDLFHLPSHDLSILSPTLVDPITDQLLLSPPKQKNCHYFATEYLPGQYDQRADSAQQCLQLLGIEGVIVRSGFMYELRDASPEDLQAAKTFLINPIESREKNLDQLTLPQASKPLQVPIIEGFITKTTEQLKQLHQAFGFSFGLDDLQHIQQHFHQINRNPTQTELKVLDTYWSDHCRHTTFETEITQVKFNTPYQETLQKTYNNYLKIRQELGIKKPIRLMDLATIMGKHLIKTGKLNNIELSEEVNACSIEVMVDEDGTEEPWLLMFKNETHNHPTEVEPYGGASTCIGGAIRDPLSGRAFVYQAMRITGSANPLEPIKNTLPGKLPQKKITTDAAKGYSAYGNQIGVATTLVKEIYHDNYKAKRMEVGFVMGAVKKAWVRRETPKPGDKIILLGGKTGRDGIGGATGSSKVHDGQSLSDLSAEVQKGNAPVERKIQRLFRNEQAIRLIKKCNDFGAGGVAVAIGEIADGVEINLDLIATKYQGLNGTELAISESQERMAVAVDAKDTEQFIELAQQENLQAIVVASVTNNNRVQMSWQGNTIVDLDREFLNTNGVNKTTKLIIEQSPIPNPIQAKAFNQPAYLQMLKNLNHTSQKGLVEMFDSNVGRSTVLQPMAGKYQDTPEQVSVQKLPTNNNTQTVSMASYGFNPKLTEWNPYFGSYYAVIDSVTKIVAAGGAYQDVRLTFQEYFERLDQDPKRWGKPFAALLGTIEAQQQLGIAAIGGKDSMSGSYQEIDVPPTLISFAVCPSKLNKIRSSCLQHTDSKLYLFIPKQKKDLLLDGDILKAGFEFLHQTNKVLSARAVEFAGLSETLSLMAFGNEIGFDLNTQLPKNQYLVGAIVLETKHDFDAPVGLKDNLLPIGKTNTTKEFNFGDFVLGIELAKQHYKKTLQPIFPESKPSDFNSITCKTVKKTPKATALASQKTKHPLVVIPVFPGTNSEYDSAKAFNQQGATSKQIIIRNLNQQWLDSSISDFCESLNKAHILFIPGGFSAADEPDGSGKFMASFLRNQQVRQSVSELLQRKGLILGICNGFQALVKCGLLPHGKIADLDEDSPILYHNNIGRHVAQMVKIKVVNDWSPWLSGMQDKEFWMPVSHGEGRFMASKQQINQLFANGQVATQYVDFNGNPTQNMPFNPNDSFCAIEGITSPCGLIYGRMGHPERVEQGLFKNIPNIEPMNIFKNAVDYFL